MVPDIKHGKAFEKRVDAQFRNLYKDHPVKWERPPDSAEAGDVIRKADSDYRYFVPSLTDGAPYSFLVECKATVRNISFRTRHREFLSRSQNSAMAAMRRCGGNGFVLFQDLHQGIIEVWGARGVNAAFEQLRTPIDSPANMAFPDTEENILALAMFILKYPATFSHQINRVSDETYFYDKAILL